jgi:copper-binding protein NosD
MIMDFDGHAGVLNCIGGDWTTYDQYGLRLAGSGVNVDVCNVSGVTINNLASVANPGGNDMNSTCVGAYSSAKIGTMNVTNCTMTSTDNGVGAFHTGTAIGTLNVNGCTIDAGQGGVRIAEGIPAVTTVNVINCTITGGEQGVQLAGDTSTANITNCIIDSASKAVLVDDSADIGSLTITDCTMSVTAAGEVVLVSPDANLGGTITLTRNLMFGNGVGLAGVSLVNVTGTSLNHNTIAGCVTGLDLGTSNNTIINTLFADCVTGVVQDVSASNNVLNNNGFIENTADGVNFTPTLVPGADIAGPTLALATEVVSIDPMNAAYMQPTGDSQLQQNGSDAMDIGYVETVATSLVADWRLY